MLPNSGICPCCPSARLDYRFFFIKAGLISTVSKPTPVSKLLTCSTLFQYLCIIFEFFPPFFLQMYLFDVCNLLIVFIKLIYQCNGFNGFSSHMQHPGVCECFCCCKLNNFSCCLFLFCRHKKPLQANRF